MSNVWRAPLLALGFSVLALAQAGTSPTKIGIVNFREAIAQTSDGKKATAELETKFGPRQKEFDKRQQDLQQMETQLRQGANTMNEDARQKLMRDIDLRRKQLQRDLDDAQQELEQEQGRLFQELGQRMMAVVNKYAADNGYALVLDVSSMPPLSLMYASNALDITTEVIGLYEKGAAMQPRPSGGAAATPPATGVQGATAPATGATPPVVPAPRPAAPKPAAPKK